VQRKRSTRVEIHSAGLRALRPSGSMSAVHRNNNSPGGGTRSGGPAQSYGLMHGHSHIDHSQLDAAMVPKPDEIAVDFAQIKYNCYSFRTISGGLRKNEFPGVRYCSPVKIARGQHGTHGHGHGIGLSPTSPDERPDSEGHHANESSRLYRQLTMTLQQQQQDQQRLQQQQQQGSRGPATPELCAQCSIFDEDYIANKFKWHSPSSTDINVNNMCPRSCDVIGECPVCNSNSLRKSKINWKSIYEVNLSLAVPLIKELPTKEEKQSATKLSQMSTKSRLARTRMVALEDIGKHGGSSPHTNPQDHPHSHPHSHGVVKVNVDRNVSWAGHRPSSSHRSPVSKPEELERPHTTGSTPQRVTATTPSHRSMNRATVAGTGTGTGTNSNLFVRQQSFGASPKGQSSPPHLNPTQISRQSSQQHSSRQTVAVSNPRPVDRDGDTFDAEATVGAMSRLSSANIADQRPKSASGDAWSRSNSNSEFRRIASSNSRGQQSGHGSRPNSAQVLPSASGSGKLFTTGSSSGKLNRLSIDTTNLGRAGGQRSPSSPSAQQLVPVRGVSSRGVRLPLVMISGAAQPSSSALPSASTTAAGDGDPVE
jgi:hypothetical protein